MSTKKFLAPGFQKFDGIPGIPYLPRKTVQNKSKCLFQWKQIKPRGFENSKVFLEVDDLVRKTVTNKQNLCSISQRYVPFKIV